MAALPAAQPLLAVRDLQVTFPGAAGAVRAVDGVSLAVDPGEVVALVGESGSGKTATALAAMGLLPAGARVRGEVLYAGADLLSLPEQAMETIRGRHVAIMLQEAAGALDPVLPVGEQVAEVLRRHAGLRGRAALARAAELLQQVGLRDAGRLLHRYPHQLSGGMRQLVLLAQALAGDPQVLIADEPTTALDMGSRAHVRRVLAQLRRARGLAMLLITHDLAAVAGLADRVAVMYAGTIMEAGPAAALFAAPAHPYTQALLAAIPRLRGGAGRLTALAGQPPDPARPPAGCPFAPRCPRAEAICHVHRPTLTGGRAPERPVACWLAGAAPARPAAGLPAGAAAPGGVSRATGRPPAAGGEAGAAVPPAGAAILELRDLVKRFSAGPFLARSVVRAVDGVSLDLAAGETLALVGESGSGKTTLGRTVLRLHRPDGGLLRFLGTDIGALGEAALVPLRRRIGAVFQDPTGSLNPRFPVSRIIAEPLQAAGVAPKAAQERVRELLDLVGLGLDYAPRLPSQLSGGQRQRVGIARALALAPGLVVADEPVSALDVSVQAQIVNLFADLGDRLGISFLFITHDLALCRYLADRVAVMYRGRLVEIGPAAAVLQAPAHPYARALLAAVPRLHPGAAQAVPRNLAAQPAAGTSRGCPYEPLCPAARPQCRAAAPQLRPVGPGHQAACPHV